MTGMYTLGHPLGRYLVTMYHSIGHGNPGIGSGGHNYILASHNRLLANKRLAIHAVLNQCIVMIIILQCSYIPASLVGEMLVVKVCMVSCALMSMDLANRGFYR